MHIYILEFYSKERSKEKRTHSPRCQRDHDAGEEGEVISRVGSVPHGRQDEGGRRGVVGTALVTNPTAAKHML